MLYLSRIPVLPLGEFVDRLWICSDTPHHSRERILPSGTIELVINLRENEIRIYDSARPDHFARFSGSVVSGPYSGCFMIDPLQHASIIGVHFRPAGAAPFLGVPAHELADMHLDLETLWGRMATELRERLCAATTAVQRFSLLEETLLSRLRHAPDRHGAVSIAIEAFKQPGASVREVANRVGLSQRQFIQVFAAEVGLTPKLFCRVLRFQQARDLVDQATAAKTLDWARLAVGCGYYDQSHLIHDFSDFSGLSPTEYFCLRSDRVLRNHVPIIG